MSCSPSGTDCSIVGPPWDHKSCQQTCSIMSSSLHSSTGCAKSLLYHWLSMGSQPGCMHLFQQGVLNRLQLDIYSTVDLHRLQGHKLPHHGLYHELQGNFCSGAWSIFSSSFFISWCLQSCSSHRFSLLSPGCVCAAVFFPLLNMLLQRCYQDWLSLSQQWVYFGADWHWFYDIQRKLLAASHRSYLCSSSTTKTLPHKLNTFCKPDVLWVRGFGVWCV